jgi:hypothetical protein
MVTIKSKENEKNTGSKQSASIKKHGCKITYITLTKMLLTFGAKCVATTPIAKSSKSMVDVVAACMINGEARHMECIYDFNHSIAFNINPHLEDLLIGFKMYLKDCNDFVNDSEIEELAARHEDNPSLTDDEKQIVAVGYDFLGKGRRSGHNHD